MKAIAAIALTFAFLAAPASAFSVDVLFPNLTFPDDATAPPTQSCVDPSTLESSACPASE